MSDTEFTNIVKKISIGLNQYERTETDDVPSYFEVLTAVGFLYFVKQKVDWAVIEVGLGGRYDATNVLPKKNIAIITSIGLDHMELLGGTKEKIAFEKAGVIKLGCRVFTAEKNKKVLAVLQRECRNKKAQLEVSSFKFSVFKQTIDGIDFQYKKQNYHVKALGTHQIKNAILCIDIARALHIPEDAIKLGLVKSVQPLRMEIVSRSPLTILDGAHNPDKMRTTVETVKSLKHENLKAVNVHLIVGFSADKNWKQMIRQLATLNPASIACTRNTVNPFRKVVDPRAIAEHYKKIKKNFPPSRGETEGGLNACRIEAFLDPRDALNWTKRFSKQRSIILVTGSIFLSGELRGALGSSSI